MEKVNSKLRLFQNQQPIPEKGVPLVQKRMAAGRYKKKKRDFYQLQ